MFLGFTPIISTYQCSTRDWIQAWKARALSLSYPLIIDFYLLSKICYCMDRMSCLSIHQFLDIWFASTSRLLWLMLLWTFVYKVLYRHRYIPKRLENLETWNCWTYGNYVQHFRIFLSFSVLLGSVLFCRQALPILWGWPSVHVGLPAFLFVVLWQEYVHTHYSDLWAKSSQVRATSLLIDPVAGHPCFSLLMNDYLDSVPTFLALTFPA